MKHYHTILGFDYTDAEERYYRQAVRSAAEFMQHYGSGRQPRTFNDTSAYESLRSPDGMENLTVCNSSRCDRKLMCEHYANRTLLKNNEDKYYVFTIHKCFQANISDRPYYKPIHNDIK